MAEIKLDTPLQYIKGVGPKRAEVLAKVGMHEAKDLLYYLPRHYLDRTNVIPINNLKANESATIIGVVKAHGVLYGKRRRYEVILEDKTGCISLLWFHSINYWEKLFKKGQIFACSGMVSLYTGLQMIHPDLERLEDESDQMIHAGRIIPVYPQKAEFNNVGLNSKSIRRLTSFIFSNLSEEIEDHLPGNECREHNLYTLNEALKNIHFKLIIC
ncbi:MAG: hypothetical protein ACE5D6_07125, partial [Candidatus Zixiibacteriota bacterium]